MGGGSTRTKVSHERGKVALSTNIPDGTHLTRDLGKKDHWSRSGPEDPPLVIILPTLRWLPFRRQGSAILKPLRGYVALAAACGAPCNRKSASPGREAFDFCHADDT